MTCISVLSILDSKDSVGYVISTGSIYSQNFGINPLRCKENDTQLENCEGFNIYIDGLTNNYFVHVLCHGDSSPSKLQSIPSGLNIIIAGLCNLQ